MKILRMLLYLILIVLIAGMGCWISLGQYLSLDAPRSPESFNVFLGNLGTFAISVAVMAFADFLLMPGSVYASTKALGLYVLMALSVAAGVLSLVWHPCFIIWICVGGLSIAVIQWFMVNLDNPSFENPAGIIGGKPL